MSVSITTQWLHMMEEDTTATANWMNGLTLSRYVTLKYRHHFCCQVGRELTMVVGIHSTRQIRSGVGNPSSKSKLEILFSWMGCRVTCESKRFMGFDV